MTPRKWCGTGSKLTRSTGMAPLPHTLHTLSSLLMVLASPMMCGSVLTTSLLALELAPQQQGPALL